MIPLTNEEYELYLNKVNCSICKQNFEHKYTNDKSCQKVKGHFHYKSKYRGAAHSICNLKYSTSKKMPVGICNGLN